MVSEPGSSKVGWEFMVPTLLKKKQSGELDLGGKRTQI
jgi:hypothetical protein